MTEGEEIFFTHYVEYIDKRLHRFFVKILGAFAILGITIAVSFFYIAHVAAQNNAGLCALRADAQQRIDSTEDFLKENPEGIPGISPAVLKRGVDTATKTRDALSELNCEL